MLNEAAISWRASRTTLIVLNAADFELYSLSSATQEAIYLRKVCIELGFLQNSPTIMYEGCQAAFALSKENRFHNRSKHISARLDPHRALFHSATQYWDTHRCPSHCNQLRRGTPLTRSWFMPALNNQRFATVLTHQLTCFSHAEYHFCVTVYQSDVKSELQSVCKENLKFTGFTLFSLTHTSIDMHT